MKIENRVIEVSYNGRNWVKRVLLFIKNNKALCWYEAKTIEKAEETLDITAWNYWREIEEKTEPKYRPFTWEERDKLRGKWIRNKSDKNFENIITALHLEKESIFKIAYEDSPFMTAQELLDSYEFVDGTPCGVKNENSSLNEVLLNKEDFVNI